MTDTANATAETASTWWAARADEQCAHVTLYRVTGAKEELLDRVTVTPDTVPTLEDFQLLVKSEFGGGEYLAVQRGEQGQYLMRQRFAVAGFAKKQTPPPEEARQPGQVSELAMLMQRSDEKFAQLLAEMRELRSQPVAAPVDPLEQIERVATILKRTGAAPAPQRSLMEQMMELKAAAELMGLSGGQGDEPEGFGWVRELVTQAAPLLIGAAKGQGGGDTPAPELRAPAVDEQAAMMKRAQLLLRGMVQLAGHKVDPAAPHTVDTIREQAGTAWPLVLDILQRDDAVQLAAGLVPEVADHVEWFEGFRAAAIAPAAPEVKTNSAGTARRTKRATA